MPDAYLTLGIPATLALDEETLRAAFREAGKTIHPDAGGGEDGFARLREAYETLLQPSRRLKHWLELRGVTVDPRGTVDDPLMELFGRVGQVSQQADSLARRRGEARSALGLALLEGETHRCVEEVERLIAEVEQAISGQCALFPLIEQGAMTDPGELARCVRNLAFLEKWRGSLRGILPRLV